MDRRLMLQGLMAVCGTGALAACSGAEEKTVATSLGGADFTQTHRNFLTQLSDVIIPQTDSPGALIAGAAAKVEEVITGRFRSAERKKWLAGLISVHTALDLGVGGDFMKASPANQANAVKKLDQMAYSKGGGVSGSYRALKSALATAYYLSEPGATEELRYEAVPGDWKACIPFSEIGRTWAV